MFYCLKRRTAVDFCNQSAAVKCWASGMWGDGPEAQNSRKGNHTDRNSGFLYSPFLVGYPPRDWRRFTSPSEQQRRLLFASLLNLSFPNRSHSQVIILLYSFCSVKSLAASWLGCNRILQLQDPARSAYSSLSTYVRVMRKAARRRRFPWK